MNSEPQTGIDYINNAIYKQERTFSPPARLLRTPEEVERRKIAAQAKRDRKNAKRLKNIVDKK